MNDANRSDGDGHTLRESILRYSRYTLGRDWHELTPREKFIAVTLAARERIIERMIDTEQRTREQDKKRVYYLSLEFLLGRALSNNLLNLGIKAETEAALAELGLDLGDLEELEPDPGLGNGGLGRLAACYLDSMATLDLAGIGYGINYEFGLFRQVFKDGWQDERPDVWRTPGNPWLLVRPDLAHPVPVYGRVVDATVNGRPVKKWIETREIVGVPSDFPIVGDGGRTVNVLRLFAARSSAEFDMDIFNSGDYVRAVEQKIQSERVSKVLYPSDSSPAGRELRLIQEYFFVACALQDIIRRHGVRPEDLRALPDRAAIQLNDTHPALAIAELMRILVDQHGFSIDEALDVTRRTMAYTNHTLLPEAAEKWPVPLLEKVLPRHLQLIFEVNDRLLAEIERRSPGDADKKRRMSLVEENHEKQVRMMHLSVFASHSVNGVSRLHTDLLVKRVLPDFHGMWPERFNNKTNGVTPRRWLANANPDLVRLITSVIGDGWLGDMERLRELEKHDDAALRSELFAVKRWHKERLARLVRATTGVVVDPQSLFDVQVKRIHEYKRQLMNALRIVHQWLVLVEDKKSPRSPRTFVFGGKAAPGYTTAKLIIKLINEIARVVNSDPRTGPWMRVAFVPDYRVTLAERIIPAADVSEQISTAGTEASGTGNMKFMMNGALTVGTLDGANVEMLEQVGRDNIFIFGMTADEVEARRASRGSPEENLKKDARVARAIGAIEAGRFSNGDVALFRPLVDSLKKDDPYFITDDLGAFIDVQERVDRLFGSRDEWFSMALINIARSGRFSSDRAVREYAREIWGAS